MSTKPWTHNEIQWERRANFLEEARQHRRTVVSGNDVAVVPTHRGLRRGVYVGRDGDSPSLSSDVGVLEIDPGTTSTLHRHSWDATLFMTAGSGWTEINGRRFDWKPWDAIHLPAWSWHRHGNDGQKTARIMTFSSAPIVEALGMAVLQDAGHASVEDLPRQPEVEVPDVTGDDPDAVRATRLLATAQRRSAARLHTPYDQLEFLPTVKGTKSSFLVDRELGYETSGLTQAMKIFAPGKPQSIHAHPGEAWLYVIEGYGHSYFGEEAEGGITVPWKAGDIICVDHFLWHQHFNDDPDQVTRLIRVHMSETLGLIMRALADPLVLNHEPAWALEQAADISKVEWPAERRPD